MNHVALDARGRGARAARVEAAEVADARRVGAPVVVDAVARELEARRAADRAVVRAAAQVVEARDARWRARDPRTANAGAGDDLTYERCSMTTRARTLMTVTRARWGYDA